jgi:hypothetical protein
MYKVYCDGSLMYDPMSKELSIIEPTLELALNSAGSFSFSMTQNHPFYDSIKNMKSEITVNKDGKEIFSGRVIQPGNDFFNRKSFVVEGELAYLNDSIQRPKEYHNISIENYLKDVISIHNEQMEESKQFTVGTVTVVDSNDSIYKISNYENTWQILNEKLLGVYGGYFFIRKENGIRYIDYLAEMPHTNSQVIQFGKNLLDFSSNIELMDIATALIPLGAKDDETETRLTIASVNDGSDVIVSEEAKETYGYICKKNTWDDVTVASNLLRKGKEYLSSIQWENLILNVNAVDLHDLDVDMEAISIGDNIRVYSVPHGLDRYFPVSEMEIKLDSPADNSISLGVEVSRNTSTRQIEDIRTSVESVQQDVEDVQSEVAQSNTRIDQTESSIELEVQRATEAEGTLSSKISMTEEQIALKVSKGEVSSQLSVESGQITISSNRLVIDSTNFGLDSYGNATVKGSLQYEYGDEEAQIISHDARNRPMLFMYSGEFDGDLTVNGSINGSASSADYATTAGTLTGTAGSVHVGAYGFIPNVGSSMRLGASGYKWTEVFSDTGEINTSDRNEKKNISDIDEKYIRMFELLVPQSFMYINGTSGRTHIGFISQDVESAMQEVGISDLEFAGFCKDEVEQEDGTTKTVYGLRYSEFIALNTLMIQKTRNELSELKNLLIEKGVI